MEKERKKTYDQRRGLKLRSIRKRSSSHQPTVCSFTTQSDMTARPQRKFDVLSVCSTLLATFISDYEYEIEYEDEFSNGIYLPPIITYQNNLLSNICVLVSNGKELRFRDRISHAEFQSYAILAFVFALVVKSKGR